HRGAPGEQQRGPEPGDLLVGAERLHPGERAQAAARLGRQVGEELHAVEDGRVERRRGWRRGGRGRRGGGRRGRRGGRGGGGGGRGGGGGGAGGVEAAGGGAEAAGAEGQAAQGWAQAAAAWGTASGAGVWSRAWGRLPPRPGTRREAEPASWGGGR